MPDGDAYDEFGGDPLRMRDEIERLRALLVRVAEGAVEDIDHWASYAGDYFHEKWDLQGDLARYQKVIESGGKP